jgi:hypothetical protein
MHDDFVTVSSLERSRACKATRMMPHTYNIQSYIHTNKHQYRYQAWKTAELAKQQKGAPQVVEPGRVYLPEGLADGHGMINFTDGSTYEGVCVCVSYKRCRVYF